jgi:hypothetical protein
LTFVRAAIAAGVRVLDYWVLTTNGLAVAAELKQLSSSVQIMMLSR